MKPYITAIIAILLFYPLGSTPQATEDQPMAQATFYVQ